MTRSLRVVVPGEPVAWERSGERIASKADGSQFIAHYTPKETAAYQKHVGTIAQLEANKAQWLVGDPKALRKRRYRVLLTVYRTHEGKGGDADNYFKTVSDALNGVTWEDDRYVRELAVLLRQDAANPRMVIEVQEIERRTG